MGSHRNVPATLPARMVTAHDDERAAAHAGTDLAAYPFVAAAAGRLEYKYHVDAHVLGSGYQGTVRRCVDRVTGRRCAVKSVRRRSLGARRDGLAREVALLGAMKHRHIVHLRDVYEDAECVHLVTDLCAGGELFDRICNRAAAGGDGVACFAEDEAAWTVRQILGAVAYMHKRGVVHRDLKPENILYETTDDDSPIKIVDYGLARKHRPGREPPMRSRVGTSYYMAPEVLRGDYDRACDLWSIGVLTYVLLCGYPPFNGADADAIHRAVLKGRYDFPEEDWQGVGAEARDFVRQLLRMDPRKRMTVEQALSHPWMARHACAGDLTTTHSCDDVFEDLYYVV